MNAGLKSKGWRPVEQQVEIEAVVEENESEEEDEMPEPAARQVIIHNESRMQQIRQEQLRNDPSLFELVTP